MVDETKSSTWAQSSSSHEQLPTLVGFAWAFSAARLETFELFECYLSEYPRLKTIVFRYTHILPLHSTLTLKTYVCTERARMTASRTPIWGHWKIRAQLELFEPLQVETSRATPITNQFKLFLQRLDQSEYCTEQLRFYYCKRRQYISPCTYTAASGGKGISTTIISGTYSGAAPKDRGRRG